MFLEVDLGTEALRIWKVKTENYLRLATSGEFAATFGRPQFRVLVACRSEARLQPLRSLIASFTDKIFWFATLDAINRDGFWSPIWVRPKSEQKQSLL